MDVVTHFLLQVMLWFGLSAGVFVSLLIIFAALFGIIYVLGLLQAILKNPERK